MAAALAAAAIVLVGVFASPALAAEPGNTCQASNHGRFADCQSGYYTWTIRKDDPLVGPVIGTASIAFTISETVSPRSRDWTAHFTVYVLSLTGVATEGTTAAVVPECGGGCTAGKGLPDKGSWLEENQTLDGDITFSSEVKGRATSTQSINVYLFHPAAVGTGTTQGDPRSVLGPVRCDDAAKSDGLGGLGRAGCVISDYIPTFYLRGSEWSGVSTPAHDAFVAAAQNDPRTKGWGKPGAGKPLTREYLGDDYLQGKKRDQVCPRSWPRNPSPPGTPEQLRDSCDEYPYSGSRQGTPAYAVTGHVPLGQNRLAGARLSAFIARYHVLDGDSYYVQP